MFYIVKAKPDSKYTVIEILNTTDATYHYLKTLYVEVKGQYGIKDYARIWKQYYNGKFTIEQTMQQLDSTAMYYSVKATI